MYTMRVFRASDAERHGRAGYEATYIADLVLKKSAKSLGLIVVDIPKGMKTSPHLHRDLEEFFVALTPLTVEIGGESRVLDAGDVAVAEPGEAHSFRAPADIDARLLAIKAPNLKDDKISLD